MFATKRGAKVFIKPKALNERQRIGKGIEWILEACRYRPGITFPERLAQEILGVLKGDSQALAKKREQHGLATVNRFVVDLCLNLQFAHTFNESLEVYCRRLVTLSSTTT